MGMSLLELRTAERPKCESPQALHNVAEQTKQKDGRKEETKRETNESPRNVG